MDEAKNSAHCGDRCPGGVILIRGLSRIPAGASKVIRFVVPFARGGQTENLVCPLRMRLGETLGATFILDYKPGAGASLGTETVVRSAPDRHTILITVSTIAAIVERYKRLTVHHVRDLAPMAALPRHKLHSCSFDC